MFRKHHIRNSFNEFIHERTTNKARGPEQIDIDAHMKPIYSQKKATARERD